MGLLNWFSWQLERRAMLKEMDRLRADLSETERQLYITKRDAVTLRSDLGEAQLQLHELAAEEQNKLETELELHKSAAAYWESVAKNQQKRIAELRRPASELTSVIEATEPAESELERKAWELWLRGDDSIEGVWRKAELWLRARDGRRKEQERLTDEQ